MLDALALLALLNQEPGHEQVAGTIPHAAISAVNLSEVVAKLADNGMPPEFWLNGQLALDLYRTINSKRSLSSS